jgi:predicted SAM-dependent methyltransferase
MIKLHLGSGEKHMEGYQNVDIRYLKGVDVVSDIRYLRTFKENSIDVIYACAVLEHIIRWEYKSVLQRWYDIIKPGGVLRISVPNFEALAEYYMEHKDLNSLIGMLYGGQDYEQNFHHMTWDFKTLSQDLKDVGFKSIDWYDWRDTEHSDMDDYSQAYLPHMDKENGKLMHLNLEAIK